MYLIKGNYHFFGRGDRTFWLNNLLRSTLCVMQVSSNANNNQHECGSCLFSERFTFMLRRDNTKVGRKVEFYAVWIFLEIFQTSTKNIQCFPGRKWDFYVGAIEVNLNSSFYVSTRDGPSWFFWQRVTRTKRISIYWIYPFLSPIPANCTSI